MVCDRLGLKVGEPDLADWVQMVEKAKNLPNQPVVKIALVGKYVAMYDAYISITEALNHGGIANDANVEILWINSENITDENAAEILGEADGIIVPGGFGDRGLEGMISAAKYARENGVPYFGICLGMQMAVIEFARHVAGFADANTTEVDTETTHPVIDIMADQVDVENKGGTLRLGVYPCKLAPGTKIYDIYADELVYERHRHRYEVNNEWREALAEAGLVLSGLSPDKKLVETMEVANHPWFIGVQSHPELKSRPNKPHPLFASFVKAALENRK